MRIDEPRVRRATRVSSLRPAAREYPLVIAAGLGRKRRVIIFLFFRLILFASFFFFFCFSLPKGRRTGWPRLDESCACGGSFCPGLYVLADE
jgi:hypothetical protein